MGKYTRQVIASVMSLTMVTSMMPASPAWAEVNGRSAEESAAIVQQADIAATAADETAAATDDSVAGANAAEETASTSSGTEEETPAKTDAAAPADSAAAGGETSDSNGASASTANTGETSQDADSASTGSATSGATAAGADATGSSASGTSAAGTDAANAGSAATGTSTATDSAAAAAPAKGAAVDNTTTLADGTYTPEAFAHRIAAEGSADISIASTQIVVRGGKAFAQVTFGDATLAWALAGDTTVTDRTTASSTATFEVPVNLNAEETVAVGSAENVQSGVYIIDVTLAEPIAEAAATGKTATSTAAETSEKSAVESTVKTKIDENIAAAMTTADAPEALLKTQALYSGALTPQSITTDTSVPTGTYTLTGGAKDGMFRIVDCTITSDGGAMSAYITLSGTGQDHLFIGTKEQAEAAGVAGSIAGTKTTNSEGKSCYAFTIPVSSLDKTISIASYAPKTGTWYDRTVTLNSSALVDTSTSTAASTVAVAPTGSYTLSGGAKDGMFRIVDCTISSANGKMTADITLSGTGQDHLFIGTKEQAEAAGVAGSIAGTKTTNSEGKSCYAFTIPVSSLDKPLAISSYSPKTHDWYQRSITITSANLYAPVAVSYAFVSATAGMTLPSEVTAQLSAPKSTTSSSATIANEFADAAYTDVAVKDSTGGLVGTWKFTAWDNASAANTGDPVSFTGRWTYVEANSYAVSYRFVSATDGMTLPAGVTSQLGTASVTSAHQGASIANEFSGKSYSDVKVTSSPQGTWKFSGWDKTQATVTADTVFTGSWTFEKSQSGDTGGGTGGNTGGGTGGNTGGSTDTGSATSSSGDSSTTLADGTYAPDSFSWGGGSGRLSGMSCTSIRVSGGQTWATIVLQSSSYSELAANGGTYSNLTPGSSVSTFEIPVALNQNMTISGLTTAMSAPHWVTYTIFVGLAAAGNSTSATTSTVDNTASLDVAAPTIAGLTYQSETAIEHAKYFKIYNYDQGIKLIEIDLSTDTARSEATGTAATGTSAGTASTSTGTASSSTTTSATATSASTGTASSASAASSSTSTTDTSDAAIKAELYKGNVVKYLVVPAGVEIPAGLDKEVIVIQQPTEKGFVASSQALSTLDKLGLTGQISNVGIAQDKITVDSVKQAITDKKITVSGTYDNPTYKDLVSSKCDLIIQDEALLPHVAKDKVAATTTTGTVKADADDANLTVDEQVTRFEEMGARCATLGIPMLVDRSADESSALAQAEWVKVYGAIYGVDDQADAIYAAAKTAAGA